MNGELQEIPEQDATFVGEVSDPYCSLTITKGLIELKVHPTNGGAIRHDAAQLITQNSKIYPVTVRAHGRVQPNLTLLQTWSPGDFLIRVDGITLEEGQQVQKIVQGPETGSETFLGEIIEATPLEEGLISVRVRPYPYLHITKGKAELLDDNDRAIAVTLHRITAAPPSPTLGRFGDLIAIIEGITLEQVKEMQKLRQPPKM